jgi:hypothetical protein
LSAAPLGRALVLAALALLGVSGAVRAEPDRAEWLRKELLARNRDLLARDPGAVAQKLERMAHTKFAYLRGAVGLLPSEPSRFVTPAAARIALSGDPHPENIGVVRTPRGERVIELNDFDLAGYGPYVEDVRRLALSLWILADMGDVGKKHRGRIVESMLDGYVEEIQGLQRGQPPVALRAETAFGGALATILADADDEERALERGVPATAAERALAEEALGRYPATLLAPAAFPKTAFAIKRLVRVNVGVGSYPVLRLRAVVEGPSAQADDDWVLELKEARERKAAVLVAIERQFHETPDEDPLLGWASVNGHELRVRRLTADQQRLSAARIAKEMKSPRWKKKDLRAFSLACGRLLARGHALTKDSTGVRGLSAIAGALGDGSGLREETVGYATRAGVALDQDFKLYRGLLAQYGPLLGRK